MADPGGGGIAPSEYQCSICCDLLLDPVVGSCGHDFCKSCIESWFISRRQVGLEVHCPLCRAALSPPTDAHGFGVCIRLRETVEKLFPELSAARRDQARLKQQQAGAGGAGQGHNHFMDDLLSSSGLSSPLSMSTSEVHTHTRSNSPELSAAASQGSGHGSSFTAPPSSPSEVHAATTTMSPEFLGATSNHYRDLTHIVSALWSLPLPPANTVSAFLDEASSAVEREVQRVGTGPILSQQQAAELAQSYLSHTAGNLFAQSLQGATSTAAGSPEPASWQTPAMQAALALLTSAAATSTAAEQLRTLLSTIQTAYAPYNVPADTLQATSHSVHQLTSGTASALNMLRAQYSLHLQQRVQAQAQAQAFYNSAQWYLQPVMAAAAAAAAAAAPSSSQQQQQYHAVRHPHAPSVLHPQQHHYQHQLHHGAGSRHASCRHGGVHASYHQQPVGVPPQAIPGHVQAHIHGHSAASHTRSSSSGASSAGRGAAGVRVANLMPTDAVQIQQQALEAARLSTQAARV